MSRKKISQLESATDVTASDLLQIVDVEDGDMAPSGTNKKVTAQILGNYLPVTATGSTTARSLANRFADTVNVKDFGAVGDGVTDDTAAIQAAITAMSPWGTLIIPEGVYKTTSTITLPAFYNLNGVMVTGVGNGTVIKPTSAVTTVFNCLGDFITFDGLQIDGSLTSNATGIVLNGGNNNNNVTVKNCFFGVMSKGVELRTDSWSVHSCRFTDVTTAIDCANWAMNGSCYDNYVLGGITSIRLTKDNSVASPKRAEGVRIFSNCFLNTAPSAKAIIIEAGLEISIFNNIVDQTGSAGYGIYAQAMTGDTISHIKIQNNWLAGGVTSAGHALWVSQGSGDNANNIWIEGNTLTSTDVATNGATLTNIAGYWLVNNQFYCGNPSGSFLLTTPLTITTSNFGTVFGNRGLTTETASVDNNTLRGQLKVENSTVGATNITAKLGGVETKIASISGAGFAGTQSNTDFVLQANNTNRMRIVAGGDIVPATDNSINFGNANFRWASLWSSNGIVQTSDSREKTEITPTTLGLDFIKALNPVSYKWIVGGNRVIGAELDGTPIFESVKGQRTHYGLLAQEVKEAIPDGVDFGGWVLNDKNDQESQQALRYDQFIAPMIKAIQELTARVEELEASH